MILYILLPIFLLLILKYPLLGIIFVVLFDFFKLLIPEALIKLYLVEIVVILTFISTLFRGFHLKIFRNIPYYYFIFVAGFFVVTAIGQYSTLFDGGRNWLITYFGLLNLTILILTNVKNLNDINFIFYTIVSLVSTIILLSLFNYYFGSTGSSFYGFALNQNHFANYLVITIFITFTLLISVGITQFFIS